MNGMIVLFREWMGSGVPSGLQNQYEELRASWVGSIPTHSRQYEFKCLTNTDLAPISAVFARFFIFDSVKIYMSKYLTSWSTVSRVLLSVI